MKSMASNELTHHIRELPPLAPGISLWIAALDRENHEVDALANRLSPDEHQRAARFGTDQLRSRWIAGRATLRQILGDVLHIAPDAVKLTRGKRGRPQLQGAHGIDFNVSHTDGVALIGIAHALPPDARIGVDIERIGRSVNADGLARKFLTANERDHSAQLTADERRIRFLRLWTCKEAMSKATGDALSAPFGKMEVSLEDGPALVGGPAPYLADRWSLFAADAPSDLIATVALWRGD
jgi:4'-phosphopantetheinyl transferase